MLLDGVPLVTGVVFCAAREYQACGGYSLLLSCFQCAAVPKEATEDDGSRIQEKTLTVVEERGSLARAGERWSGAARPCD